MLKTTGSSLASASRVDDDKGVSGGGGDSSTGADGRSVSESDMSRKTIMSKNWTKNGHSEEFKFLTSKAKKAFNYLKQAFTKTSILQHFDLKCHIQNKTNTSDYVIGRVLSQLTSNQLTLNETIKSSVELYLLTYFSKKMISAETQYKTHNSELLAIVEAFKTWQRYLEGCKYKVLVFINHNNLCQFINTKCLSSRQVR